MKKIILSVAIGSLALFKLAYSEVITSCEDNGKTYSLTWDLSEAPSQHGQKKGCFTLYVQNESGHKSVLAKIERDAIYQHEGPRWVAGNVSLVVSNGNAWLSTESPVKRTDLFRLSSSGERTEWRGITWPFGGDILSEKNARFSLKNGIPVLTLYPAWTYSSEQLLAFDFTPLPNGTWLEISDGLNEVFVRPKTPLEWDTWIERNIKKRNVLRLKQNPGAIPYELPKVKSTEGFLLEHPDQIDDFLGAKLITAETAQEIRNLISTRSKQESENTIENTPVEKDAQRIEPSELQKPILLYGILTVLFLGGILFWKRLSSHKTKSPGTR